MPAVLACRRTIATADLLPDLRQIVCPTLIVHGDKDASAYFHYRRADGATYR